MKERFLLFCLALALAACGGNSGPSDGKPAEDKTNVEPEEVLDPNAGGNAGDESQPNTMAPAAADDRDQWIETWTGTLDGKIEVAIELYGIGDVLRGTITYKSTGKPITLLGKRYDAGNYYLREYQPSGLITGFISAQVAGEKMTGMWSNANKELKLAMKLVDNGADLWPYPVKGSVAGLYSYSYPDLEEDPNASGSLSVKVQGDKVTFSFDCITGPPGYHMATMEDTEATLEGNVVRYHSSEYGECSFEIEFHQGFAAVRYVDEAYDCGFGANAGVEGEYIKVR